MMFKRFIYFLFVMLFMINQTYAAAMIGKLYVYNINPKNPQVHPIFEGDRIKQGNKYVLRLNGATMVADSNTDVQILDEHGVKIVKIASGIIRFRVSPQKIRISFRTPQGEVFTPEVIKASTNIIDGQITVKDNTIVELNEGTLEALTLNGVTKIESGEGVLLTQANIAQSDIEQASENSTPPASNAAKEQITTNKNLVAVRDKEIPENIR